VGRKFACDAVHLEASGDQSQVKLRREAEGKEDLGVGYERLLQKFIHKLGLSSSCQRLGFLRISCGLGSVGSRLLAGQGKLKEWIRTGIASCTHHQQRHSQPTTK
jgi:hypothetical protein